MIKVLAAMTGAAMAAAAFVVISGAGLAATASDPVSAPAAVKADRLATQEPEACLTRAWPYAVNVCSFEARWQGEERKVRIVSTDRVAMQ